MSQGVFGHIHGISHPHAPTALMPHAQEADHPMESTSTTTIPESQAAETLQDPQLTESEACLEPAEALTPGAVDAAFEQALEGFLQQAQPNIPLRNAPGPNLQAKPTIRTLDLLFQSLSSSSTPLPISLILDDIARNNPFYRWAEARREIRTELLRTLDVEERYFDISYGTILDGEEMIKKYKIRDSVKVLRADGSYFVRKSTPSSPSTPRRRQNNNGSPSSHQSDPYRSSSSKPSRASSSPISLALSPRSRSKAASSSMLVSPQSSSARNSSHDSPKARRLMNRGKSETNLNSVACLCGMRFWSWDAIHTHQSTIKTCPAFSRRIRIDEIEEQERTDDRDVWVDKNVQCSCGLRFLRFNKLLEHQHSTPECGMISAPPERKDSGK